MLRSYKVLIVPYSRIKTPLRLLLRPIRHVTLSSPAVRHLRQVTLRHRTMSKTRRLQLPCLLPVRRFPQRTRMRTLLKSVCLVRVHRFVPQATSTLSTQLPAMSLSLTRHRALPRAAHMCLFPISHIFSDLESKMICLRSFLKMRLILLSRLTRFVVMSTNQSM